MTRLWFYEKPGCVGNREQLALLQRLGYQPEVRNLLSQPWTVETLRPFFGSKPVSEWFNSTAPAVRNGAIEIARLEPDQALRLMLAEPLLIRRPLLQYGSFRQSGFESGPVLIALGIPTDLLTDLNSCPVEADRAACAVIDL
ncbi:ArsC/Spx/MgsR family protein [Sedimenticola thiotaurini]|uniref:Nitrogenase-associated protein n=1 Tax=Sedimenticola thiotaurini TaxID=1543721 RepID=A0A0F7K3A8_9GAMM|nr:ArsC/Spx/MgsR family protein [Sedimenticola thiotaurini]AKH21695.1 hypothetical protein AAY24_16580 [Sedimenticola thiotaurini]